MSLETEMRERVKRGESLDSIMPFGQSVSWKQKKNNPRKDYIKQLENSYIENAILPNLELATIIMTLDIADGLQEKT